MVLHGLDVDIEVVPEDIGLDGEDTCPVEAAPLGEHTDILQGREVGGQEVEGGD